MQNTLLPKQADNNYGYHKAILFVFAAMTLLTLVRSLAHIFLPDGGANSIATIITFDGTPDPDAVIYNIFALWGLAQLAMGVVYFAATAPGEIGNYVFVPLALVMIVWSLAGKGSRTER